MTQITVKRWQLLLQVCLTVGVLFVEFSHRRFARLSAPVQGWRTKIARSSLRFVHICLSSVGPLLYLAFKRKRKGSIIAGVVPGSECRPVLRNVSPVKYLFSRNFSGEYKTETREKLSIFSVSSFLFWHLSVSEPHNLLMVDTCYHRPIGHFKKTTARGRLPAHATWTTLSTCISL